MKRIVLLLIITLGLVSVMFNYHSRFKNHSNKKTEYIYKVTRQKQISALYFSGIIMPYQTENISSPIDGVIKKIHFNYGQNVEKGQVLFEISSSKLQQIFQTALSHYLKTLDDYGDKDRQYKASIHLRQLQFISEDDFYSKKNARDEAYLLLIEAQTKLKEILLKLGLNTNLDTYKKMGHLEITKLLTKQLNKIDIKAVVSGIALSPVDATDDSSNKNKLVSKGNEVKQDQVLTTIGNLNSLSIIIKVSEIDMGRIHIGEKVKVTGPAFPGVTLNGFVDSVDNQATSDGIGLPTFPVRIKVDKLTSLQKKKIHIGMSAKIKIEIEETNVIMIPIKAVYQKNNKTLVSVQYKNKITPVIVETGDTTLDSVLIKKGLKPGDNIVNYR